MENPKKKKIQSIMSYLQEDVPDSPTPPDDEGDELTPPAEPIPVSATNLKKKKKLPTY